MLTKMNKLFFNTCVIFAIVLIENQVSCSTWAEWWTYEGISGPSYWGKLNSEWKICEKGNRQSPINIRAEDLLYDPGLRHYHVSKHRVNGTLINDGHDIRIVLDSQGRHFVNISGGPLQYHYRVSDIIIRFGEIESEGSEHSIDGRFFAAEIQIMGWNSDVYNNFSQAMMSTNGLVIISLLVQVGDRPNKEFDIIARNINYVKYKGSQLRIHELSVAELLPPSSEFMTYDGSLTYPACHETVTWIIPNKSFYMSLTDLACLREVMVGEPDQVRMPMMKNLRTIKPNNHRPIRTNINYQNLSQGCTMERTTYYQANVLQKRPDGVI